MMGDEVTVRRTLSEGAVAKWQGEGLQNLYRRFDSAPGLHISSHPIAAAHYSRVRRPWLDTTFPDLLAWCSLDRGAEAISSRVRRSGALRIS